MSVKVNRKDEEKKISLLKKTEGKEAKNNKINYCMKMK